MKIAELVGDEESEDTSRTFVFFDEGHTIGNVLRAVITQYPEVSFCGYTVPHPAENKMHFRIQTRGPPAVEILLRGLEDLDEMCDISLSTFEQAERNYKNAGSRMEINEIEETQTIT